MGVVWEWGSHSWGSLEFPLNMGGLIYQVSKYPTALCDYEILIGYCESFLWLIHWTKSLHITWDKPKQARFLNLSRVRSPNNRGFQRIGKDVPLLENPEVSPISGYLWVFSSPRIPSGVPQQIPLGYTYITGWCSTPTLLLICSSFSEKIAIFFSFAHH